MLDVSFEARYSGGTGGVGGGMLSFKLSSLSDMVRTFNNIQ